MDGTTITVDAAYCWESDFVEYIGLDCHPAEVNSIPKQLVPEVVTLAKLCDNVGDKCISEIPFSSLKRIKAYMQATTSDNQLNHTMMLHIHKEKVDNTNVVDVGNIFVDRDQSRKRLWVFGSLKYCDIALKRKYASIRTQT